MSIPRIHTLRASCHYIVSQTLVGCKCCCRYCNCRRSHMAAQHHDHFFHIDPKVCHGIQMTYPHLNTHEANRLVTRLMTSAIQTGSVTSALALIVLITFVTNQDRNSEPNDNQFWHRIDFLSPIAVSTGFAFLLGRVYSLTMLHTLNNRVTLRGYVQREASKEQRIASNIVSGICKWNLPPFVTQLLKSYSFGDLDIHRTADIHYDLTPPLNVNMYGKIYSISFKLKLASA